MDVSRSASFHIIRTILRVVSLVKKDIGFLLEPFLFHKAIILIKKRKKDCLINALEICIFLVVGCRVVETFRRFLEGAFFSTSNKLLPHLHGLSLAKETIFSMKLSDGRPLAVVSCGLCFKHVVSEILPVGERHRGIKY